MSQTLTEAPMPVPVGVSIDHSGESDPNAVVPGQPADQLELDEDPSLESARATEDESKYPTGTKLWLIIISIALVLIVATMDSSIVAVAVPAMTDEWHTTADVGWYMAAFRLCTCSFQFMFGKLYTLFSIKRIFLICVTIFLVGSLLCATAQKSLAFIVARAVCGFATAGITAGCFALVMQIMPLRKRPLFVGVAGAVEGISAISSPILGGVFVEKLSWRWCFWINLPLGAITWVFIAFLMQDMRRPEPRTWKQIFKELDLIGNLVLVPSLTCLFIALTWAGLRYPWSSPTIIGLFVAFVVLLAAFAVDQWLKQDTATLPPRILKDRSVLAGFVFTLCCNGAMNVIVYWLPTYFQAIREFSPGKSGYLMLPIVICDLLAMTMHGAGVTLVGYYVPFMLFASVLMPICAGLLTTLGTSTDLTNLLVYSGLLGFGGGIAIQAPQLAVQNTLKDSDAQIGLAVILFAQNFGPAVFVAVSQTIFTNRLSANLHLLAPSLNQKSIENMGLTDLKAHLGTKNLQAALLGLDRSLTQTWYLAVGLTCVTMVGSATMEWRSVKQKRS